MKTSALILALALGLALSAFAADKTKDSRKSKPASKEGPKPSQVEASAPREEKNVTLTGSFIKRDIRRNGVVTDGPLAVYIIDNKAIRNSGATTVSELLMRKGLGR